MNFGERLRELRLEMELTQENLASKIGQQKASISKYETSRIEPNIEILEKLSNIFNVSIDYIVGKTNSRKLRYDTPYAKESQIEYEVLTITEQVLRDLSKEEQQKVLEYINFIKSQRDLKN